MRPDIYDYIFQYAKTYIEENSIYSPKVLKTVPAQSNIFPLVIIPECKLILDNETLKYGEQVYKIIFNNIEIYSTDKTVGTKKIAKQTIIQELQNLIYQVFEEHFHLLGGTPNPEPNADINIARQSIEFTGKIKNNIIYRR